MAKIAIIAALEREVAPLLRTGSWSRQSLSGVDGACYENDIAVVACAGIGGVAAGRMAEALIAGYKPALVVSAGLAGALTPAGKVGQVICPAVVICAGKAVPVEVASPPEIAGLRQAGTLVTASRVSGAEEKRSLARQYSADALDMEAAAVAEVAAAHGLAFMAVKAISDEYNFPMPNLDRFIDEQGRFQTGRFAFYIAFRPSMWRIVKKLASNSGQASRELCAALRVLIDAESVSGRQELSRAGA